MGSVNFGNAYPETPLLRHGSSLFSLTVEEGQNVLGEQGVNLGSMNMDEFFKNIWTLEESQAMASAMNPIEGLNRGLSTQFSLQNQGSLCLPRTLSTKAVEDLWKTILSQQGNTEAPCNGINHHQRQISLEDFLVKAEAGKERPPHGEVTLEDFLVKAGIVRDGPPSSPVPSNHVRMASDNPVSINQTQQVQTNQTMVPSSQAHQLPVRPFLVPANQQHNGSVIQTSMPSNQVQQQAPPFPGHQQATSIQSTLTPSNPLSSLPVHQHATPILSSPVPERAPGHRAFMGFGGFPISRNDGGPENKNGQAAPHAMNSFASTAANALSCPPPSGKTQLDALNSMFLPGQQSDWMNNPYGKSITQQNQLVQRQAIAEAPSALSSVVNASNGPSLESSPGRLPPLGGGFGAALGTGGLGMSRGGNAYPTRISFGPCSPLSPEFDERSPETSNLPLSIISDFGNGQLQRKKRSADPPVERVIERRQRRMIKNRESAARSRARKQAYTVELEAEVSQLKEENMELLRKQEEEAALRKKQILALMPSTPEIACKGRYLKRTHTGPW